MSHHHSDIISFDLQAGKGSVLDIASMFPISSVHAIRSTKPILDTLAKWRGKTHDFSLSRKLSIKRFRTLVTLDLSTSEFWQPSLLTTKILQIRPRFHTIDLVPPLEIPFGSLDIRREIPILSEQKYGDIYRRKLPASLHLRREWKNTRTLLKRKRRSILATLFILASLSIPALLYTKFLVEDGLHALAALRNISDKTTVLQAIHTSRGDFERANILFMPFRWVPQDQFRLASIAIDGGLALTRGMDAVVNTIPTGSGEIFSGSIIHDSLDDSSLPSFRAKARDITLLAPLGIDTPTEWLNKNQDTIRTFATALHDASVAFDRARNISDSRKDELIHIGNTFGQLEKILGFYESHEKNILQMLGHDEPQRYIIFNQNRDEIRANGGFPGSVITFTLYKGNVLDYRTDDVYYYDWNLYPYKEVPPPGVALLTDNYGLRDVNYYPDFRETLEKANAFIERSGDATLTTGIAIHQGIVEDILKEIWPVTLSGVTEPFTNENFSPLMSTLVEARHGEVNTPKDTLFRFIGALAAKINEKRAYDTVLTLLEEELQNGEILFASRDIQVDDFLSNFRKELPWQCGTMNNTGANNCSRNWAYPVLTSVSGNKSDRFMKRLYESDTFPVGSCQYQNKMTFTHTHSYEKSDTTTLEKYLDFLGIKDQKIREKMLFVQGNGANRTYMRLYTPKGSALTGSTIGIETVEKDDSTVFTWLMETPVGASTSKTIRYTTPIADCQTFTGWLNWYRQPGLQNTMMK